MGCLQEALKKLKYDLERALEIVASRNFPDELVELVARKARVGFTTQAERVRSLLKAQCPAVQPRLEAAAGRRWGDRACRCRRPRPVAPQGERRTEAPNGGIHLWRLRTLGLPGDADLARMGRGTERSSFVPRIQR